MALSSPIDPEALFAESQWMRALARSLVQDPGQADDLVQETWVAALSSAPPTVRDLRGWLAKVLRNAATQVRRSEARRRTREERSARAVELPSVADLSERADLHVRLVQLVLELEEPYCSTLLLRFFEELTPKQIAERQGVPRSTVDTRLARGLALLRTRLDDQTSGGRSAWLAALAPLALPAHRAGSSPSVWWLALAGSVLTTWALVRPSDPRPGSGPPALVTPRTELGDEAAPGAAATASPAGAGERKPVRPTAVDERTSTTTLHGYVFDLVRGTAVAGAAIHVGPEISPLPHARSDANGLFAVELDGVQGTLIVLAEGYAGLRRVFDVRSDVRDGPLRLALVRGASVRGRVWDASGQPVAGARVALRHAPYPAGARTSELSEGLRNAPHGSWYFEGRDVDARHVRTTERTTSDASGRFELRGLVSNVGTAALRLQATHAAHAPAASEPFYVKLPEGDLELDLVMDDGATLTGAVTGTGAATVWWDGPRATYGQADVGADGRFRFERVPTGDVRISARSRSFRSVRASQALALGAGDLRELHFDLSATTGELHGRVVDHMAAPVVDAALTLWSPRSDEHAEYERFVRQTDAQGRFRATVPAERTYEVRLSAPPHELVRPDVRVGAPAIDFELPPCGTLNLRVHAAQTQAPLERFDLFWRVTGTDSFKQYEGPPSAAPDRLVLPRGSVDLRLCAHEQGYASRTVEGVSVTDRERTLSVGLESAVELDLRFVHPDLASPRFHLFFLLREDEWDLVEGTRNSYLGFDFSVGGDDAARRHSIRRRSVTADQWGNMLSFDGRVRIRGVEPGRYRIKTIPDDLQLDPAVIEVPHQPNYQVHVQWQEE